MEIFFLSGRQFTPELEQSSTSASCVFFIWYKYNSIMRVVREKLNQAVVSTALPVIDLNAIQIHNQRLWKPVTKDPETLCYFAQAIFSLFKKMSFPPTYKQQAAYDHNAYTSEISHEILSNPQPRTKKELVLILELVV